MFVLRGCFIGILSVATTAGVGYAAYTELYTGDQYVFNGAVFSLALLVIWMTTLPGWYILFEEGPKHIKDSLQLLFLAVVIAEVLPIAWMKGQFMQWPLLGMIVIFLGGVLEMTKGDVHERIITDRYSD